MKRILIIILITLDITGLVLLLQETNTTKPTSFEIEKGEYLEFFCPLCHKSKKRITLNYQCN